MPPIDREGTEVLAMAKDFVAALGHAPAVLGSYLVEVNMIATCSCTESSAGRPAGLAGSLR